MPYAASGMISMDSIPEGIEITDGQYQAALAGMADGLVVVVRDGVMTVEPPPVPKPDPEPPTEPQPVFVVTSAQGGIALIQAGLMPSVQAVVDAADTPAEIRWAWQRALTWERSSPALAYVAGRAGITSEQMDELFAAAAVIQA
ncbi:hypothetical protein D3C71_768350 [compost metagenome]